MSFFSGLRLTRGLLCSPIFGCVNGSVVRDNDIVPNMELHWRVWAGLSGLGYWGLGMSAGTQESLQQSWTTSAKLKRRNLKPLP